MGTLLQGTGRGGSLSLKSTPASSRAVGSEKKEASPKGALRLGQLSVLAQTHRHPTSHTDTSHTSHITHIVFYPHRAFPHTQIHTSHRYTGRHTHHTSVLYITQSMYYTEHPPTGTHYTCQTRHPSHRHTHHNHTHTQMHTNHTHHI